MRFRPRSHPYAALAEEADHHHRPAETSPTGAMGMGIGGSEWSRLLLLLPGGGGGGLRMLPHCSSSSGGGEEDAAADCTARENKEEAEGRSEEDQGGRDDERSSNNNSTALPNHQTRKDPSLLRSDPFELLLPPSHPCNHSHSNRRQSNSDHSNTAEAERSARRLEQLLVATGQYLRWPLVPFHRPVEWDVLREELAATFGSDDHDELLESESDAIREREGSDANISSRGGDGDATIVGGGGVNTSAM